MRNHTLINICKVESVADDNAGLRIKVRIPYEDSDAQSLDELPYCFPLLPKMIHVNPKVGECVLVIFQVQNEAKGNRFFIGPIISQAYNMNYDPFNFSARCLFAGKQIDKPLPDPKMNPDNDGTLPDREDIAICGRQNSDIWLKPNELRLRCGFKVHPRAHATGTLEFNREDLGYIQMKYKKMKDRNNRDFSSIINVVADRINLLSHDSPIAFSLNDRKDLITDDEQINIQENTEPMVYGQRLVDYLKELVEVIKNHTHPFNQDKPIFEQSQNTTLSRDLNTLLSKNIRLN